MSGVTIHDGAVIAARSVVTKDVKAYTICGGNPARHLKDRFTPLQVAELLEIKWWDWEDDKVRNFIPLLMSDNVGDFIKKAKEGDLI
jgi:carbonic anhydrase/acetyltransferase-like protein (isoleucine patch superfamily)